MTNQIVKDTILKDSVLIKDTFYKFQHTLNFSDSNDSQLLTNVITIIIALIAALIALYQVKSNVISSSRITWIENLRDAISSYSSEISNLAILKTNFIDESKEILSKSEKLETLINEYYPKYIMISRSTDKLGIKIILYLNNKEENHNKIETLINNIYDNLHKKNFYRVNIDEVQDDLDEIVKISKLIFKKEWEKSKKIFKL